MNFLAATLTGRKFLEKNPRFCEETITKNGNDKLVLIAGPMSSGKSEILLEFYLTAERLNMPVSAYKPQSANRNCGVISSRSHQYPDLAAYTIPLLSHYPWIALPEQKSALVLIDETFMVDPILLKPIIQRLREDNHTIVATTLYYDFRGNVWPGNQFLSEQSNCTVQLFAQCEYSKEECFLPAVYNCRLNEQGKPVLSGEQFVSCPDEKYISLCHQHNYFPFPGTQGCPFVFHCRH